MKVQERIITTKTPDGKTVLTKITTLPGEETEEIEEETIETIDGETKTNKTKSQVVKAQVAVSKLPNGKEIPIKENMKTGETHTAYDEETKTTIVTKRLANGYEQSFSQVTPEGNNKSWTKTFFDPVAVEGDEEEEEIEEYETIETSGGAKKTTTTTQEAPKGKSVPAVAAPKPAAAPVAPKPAPAPAKTTTTTTSTPVKPKAATKPSEVTVVRNVANGKQEITTTVDAQGRETTKIHTMRDLPNEVEEYEEYEETHTTEEQPKTKKTTTTTQQAAVPAKKTTTSQVAVPAKATTTTVAVPGAHNPKDNVLARKVVTKGEEEIQITEEHTETEFTGSRKSTTSTSVVPSTGEKLDPKGKTTVTKVVIPGSQNTVTTKSNEQDGKQIVAKKGPSGTQNIARTTNADGSTKVQVTTTVNPEELHIEETETTNIIGDKTITTTRTEVPIPGKKKIVTQLPPTVVAGKGPKTTTTTTTTTMPVGEDRKTTTTKRVGQDTGTEVSVKTETKDGKTRLETRTKFDPIYHPAVSDGEEEIEEFEETQTFAPVKTKTTTTSRVPVDGSKKKPDAASSKTAPVKAAPKK